MSALEDLNLKILHNIAVLSYGALRPIIGNRLSFEARLIEYDFAHSNIGTTRQRILDVGCGGSKLPIELAKRGHEVYGIDVEDYPNQHYFTFVQGDITHMPFDDNFFDIVTDVSTIEHIGLGRYGDPVLPNGGKEAVEEIRRVLKPAGKVIITIPCGKDTICYSKDGVPLSRVYSSSSLVELLSGFKILEMSYIMKRRHVWCAASLSEAETEVEHAKPEKVGMTAIALIVIRKER